MAMVSGSRDAINANIPRGYQEGMSKMGLHAVIFLN